MSEAVRETLLHDAIKATTGDRNHQYGPPDQDFSRIANILSILGFEFNGEMVESHHVAMIMISLKMSRLTWGPDKRDTWLDIAGYAGCGWEVYGGENDCGV